MELDLLAQILPRPCFIVDNFAPLIEILWGTELSPWGFGLMTKNNLDQESYICALIDEPRKSVLRYAVLK